MKQKQRKNIFEGMLQNFIVFLFTYAITILCVFLFEDDNRKQLLTDTLATTTITYCLGIVIKNFFGVLKKIMYGTICSIGIAVCYVLVYVSSRNGIMPNIWFWVGSCITVLFSLISDMEKLLHIHENQKRQDRFKLFSA